VNRPHLVLGWRILLSALVGGVGAILLAFCGAYQYLEPALPDVGTLRDVRLQVPLRVYSRDGRLIAQIGEQRRIPLSLDQYPKQVINAFLAAEDDQFFHHGGVDYFGLLRATERHLRSGERSEGGGTITMQLARNIFLTPEKTYRRKLVEIFTAFSIEREFSKQEILSLYLNKIFLGQRAYGVGAAAEVYFGKSVDELTIPEIALIAGLARTPSRENPIASPDRARQRRAYVLRRMHEKSYIDDAEYQAALNATVESQLHGPSVELDAPYMAEMVRVDAVNRLGQDAYTAGYEITTTLDSRLQRSAVGAVRSALVEYDQRHGYRGATAHFAMAAGSQEKDWSQALEAYSPTGGLEPAIVIAVDERGATAFSRRVGRINLAWAGMQWARAPLPDGNVGPAIERASDVLTVGDIIYAAQDRANAWHLAQIPEAQGAFVALDPQDGAVVSLVGGFDYFASNYNRAVQAKRQPGSSFKPFLYSAALEHGFTPATVINDAPIIVDDPTLEDSWRPQNNSRQTRGPTRLREALVRSLNLVSIRIITALGPAYVADYVQRFGFPEDAIPHNLSMALGTMQASPLEMARAYAVFANGGYRVEPYYIQRIVGPNNTVVFEAQPRVVCAQCSAALGLQMDGAPTPSASPPVTSSPTEVQWGETRYLQSKELAPQVASPQNVYLMTDLMSDVIKRGTATRARQLQRSDIAGKTGTSQDRRDAWFCGFNSGLVGAAWIGFDQEKNLGPHEEGGRTALPMWMYFMADALRGMPEQRQPAPPGLVTMRISADTGLPARPGDDNAVFETFIAGHVPGDDSSRPGNGNEATAPNPDAGSDSLF
jgi:penicillin-binding protein 1A